MDDRVLREAREREAVGIRATRMGGTVDVTAPVYGGADKRGNRFVIMGDGSRRRLDKPLSRKARKAARRAR